MHTSTFGYMGYNLPCRGVPRENSCDVHDGSQRAARLCRDGRSAAPGDMGEEFGVVDVRAIDQINIYIKFMH